MYWLGWMGGDRSCCLARAGTACASGWDPADRVQATLATLSKRYPEGINHNIAYNPTEFIAESVAAVRQTVFEAVLLVVIVVIVFLQNWRSAVIPLVAIPVSLIGTFAIMAA